MIAKARLTAFASVHGILSSDEQLDPTVTVRLDGAVLGRPSLGEDLDVLFGYSPFLHQLRYVLRPRECERSVLIRRSRSRIRGTCDADAQVLRDGQPGGGLDVQQLRGVRDVGSRETEEDIQGHTDWYFYPVDFFQIRGISVCNGL